jgi:taurine dioxygenase
MTQSVTFEPKTSAEKAAFRTITATRLTPYIGAEINGVDLTKPLSEEQVAELTKALETYLVIFFRDQHISIENLVSMSLNFGELHHPPALKPHELKDHPGVLELRIDANTKQVPGEAWHSDMSCDEEPPLGSILYLHTIPEVGGDTMFASMYAAYDALSDKMKQHLEGLTAIHDSANTLAGVVPPGTILPRSSHPVIRTHPVTKRKTIYVNEFFTKRIEGVSKAESTALLQFLAQHVQEPEFQCRFRWQPHSIAFWDNRSVQHQAIFDYHPNVRSGFRTQIVGEKPF